MPKKPIEYNVPVSIRISETQKERWTNYQKDNNYASIAHMIRRIIDDTIIGNLKVSTMTKELYDRLTKLEEVNKVMVKSIELLTKDKDIDLEQLKTHESSLSEGDMIKLQGQIENYIKLKRLSEKEIAQQLMEPVDKIIEICNNLLGAGLIKRWKQNPNKYEYIGQKY